MNREDIDAVLTYQGFAENGGPAALFEASAAALRSGRIPDLGIPEGLHPVRRDGFPPENSITVLGGDFDAPLTLDSILSRPGTGCLYYGDSEGDAADRIVFAFRLNSLVVSLPGSVIMESGMAHKFCQGVGAHIDVSTVNLTTIELALQEAIINGVVHGNLGLGSAYKETGDDLTRYHGMIRERLSTDRAASKCIDVIAWWTDASDHRRRRPKRRLQRGLEIIRRFAESITVTNGGCLIIMSFRR